MIRGKVLLYLLEIDRTKYVDRKRLAKKYEKRTGEVLNWEDVQ